MAEDRYKPVSCDDHDLLEEAAMLKKRVDLEFDLEGVTQRESGTVADVFSTRGAEFVKFVADSGPLEIRLDRIISVRDA